LGPPTGLGAAVTDDLMAAEAAAAGVAIDGAAVAADPGVMAKAPKAAAAA